MPSFDDRVREGLDLIARPSGEIDVFDRVASKKRRRRVGHRAKVVALVMTAIAGTGLGTYGLLTIFDPSEFARPASPLPKNGSIAFVRTTDLPSIQSKRSEILLLDPSSREVSPIWIGEGSIGRLTWAPDGSELAFDLLSRESGSSIYRIHADGTGLTTLISGGSEPAWAPDGQTIAFLKHSIAPSQTSGINLIHPNGGSLQRVKELQPTDQIGGLSWSPDGNHIYFVKRTNVGHPPHLFRIDVSGGDERQLTEDSPLLGQPSVSADGTRILFSGFRATGEASSARGRAEIYIMKADGSGVLALTHDEAVEGGPAWSPDGKWIVYWRQSPTSRDPALWVMRPDGSQKREIYRGPAVQPAWQPVPSSDITLPPSPSPSKDDFDACSIHESEATGDFDGDGDEDQAIVAPTTCLLETAFSETQTEYSIRVTWDSGQDIVWPLRPGCERNCAALAATDFGSGGRDSLVLVVDAGASTDFIEFRWLLPGQSEPVVLTEAHGEHPVPLRLAYGGSVTHQDLITCRTRADGVPVVIATGAARVDDQATWTIRETRYAYDPKDVVVPSGSSPSTAAFSLLSTDERTEPVDSATEAPPTPPGEPCWAGANEF